MFRRDGGNWTRFDDGAPRSRTRTVRRAAAGDVSGARRRPTPSANASPSQVAHIVSPAGSVLYQGWELGEPHYAHTGHRQKTDSQIFFFHVKTGYKFGVGGFDDVGATKRD